MLLLPRRRQLVSAAWHSGASAKDAGRWTCAGGGPVGQQGGGDGSGVSQGVNVWVAPEAGMAEDGGGGSYSMGMQCTLWDA